MMLQYLPHAEKAKATYGTLLNKQILLG